MLRPRLVVSSVLLLVSLVGAADAATWYVKADAPSGGDGSPVTKAAPGSARPTITNTTSGRYHGDAIRLGNDNLVQNIHIDSASRAAVFGVNAARARIRGNLITNNMIQGNDLRRLERPWPDGFILYESQTNHFGGITLLACGPGASSYCTVHAPERPAAAATGEVVIDGTTAFTLVVRNTRFVGIGGAIGILNPNDVDTLTVMVEHSSMAGFTRPEGAKSIAAVTWTHRTTTGAAERRRWRRRHPPMWP